VRLVIVGLDFLGNVFLGLVVRVCLCFCLIELDASLCREMMCVLSGVFCYK